MPVRAKAGTGVAFCRGFSRSAHQQLVTDIATPAPPHSVERHAASAAPSAPGWWWARPTIAHQPVIKQRHERLPRTEEYMRGLVTFLADGDRSGQIIETLHELEALPFCYFSPTMCSEALVNVASHAAVVSGDGAGTVRKRTAAIVTAPSRPEVTILCPSGENLTL
jgi:hypothetical protein